MPIDGEGTYSAACRLAGSLAGLLGDRVKTITLLHVMAGKYLSTHMANIDIRVSFVLESETFKRLRGDFIDQKIRPLMKAAHDLVAGFNPRGQLTQEIVDGKPAQAIIQYATENDYSTIVMQRRCMDPVKGSFIGSVTSGILYASDCACSVYIPGTDFPVDGPVTIKKLLVPVDGSPGSAAALDEASIILKALPETEITLLHVVDVVDIADAAEKDIWPRPVQEAEALLKRNKEELVKAGIPESKISQKVLAGDPADVIAKEADDGDADIILIGRTVRSAVLEVIVGSVGRAVLGRCAKRTLAVVTPDAG